jgi:hypothetical protein
MACKLLILKKFGRDGGIRTHDHLSPRPVITHQQTHDLKGFLGVSGKGQIGQYRPLYISILPYRFERALRALYSLGFEPKHAPRPRTHTPANTHFRNLVNALKRVKTPLKIHQKYTALNSEAFNSYRLILLKIQFSLSEPAS